MGGPCLGVLLLKQREIRAVAAEGEDADAAPAGRHPDGEGVRVLLEEVVHRDAEETGWHSACERRASEEKKTMEGAKNVNFLKGFVTMKIFLVLKIFLKDVWPKNDWTTLNTFFSIYF